MIYGDSVTPGRISVGGNTPFEIEGIGFRPGMTVMVGNAAVTPLAVSANRMLAIAPALPDGVQNIAITDPDPAVPRR